MDDDEIIDISSDETENGDVDDTNKKRNFLEPIVQGVVDALGGYERDVYRMGDQVNGCLKDLKKLWRKDEIDDDRTVARIFWKTRVLPNDLIPILLATAGQGLVEDKRAIACADLMTAMTWPINLAEELKELDDELDSKADYTELLQSHLHYKAAILKPGVLEALLGVVIPPLTKGAKKRTERDGQIVNVVLHLVRNLAFIKDLPANMFLSADHAEFSALQSKLIRTLSEAHILQLVLTIAANSDNDPLFNNWNTIVLEIIYLLFRGVQPSSLSVDQSKRPADDLQRLLAQEERSKRQSTRQAPSRHSRFGTTIAVKLNPNKKQSSETNPDPSGASDHTSSSKSQTFVIHRQEGIAGETGALWDKSKRQKAWKGHKVDELASYETLSVEAMRVLQMFASEFLEECFNSFLSMLLKDIRSERAKITEKDNLRLLYVTKWFLDFFFSRRTPALKSKAAQSSVANEDLDIQKFSFSLVAEVLERPWIIWVLKRMREAVDEKPKAWTELQAGIECITQLLLLIDSMFSVDISSDPTLSEAAETLQQQLIYSGEVLDVTFESLRTYKEGTQSLAYLNSSVYMAYALFRMLERWAKGKGKGEVYVRKKKTRKGRKKKGDRHDEVPEEEEPQQGDDDVVHETMFTFEAFEMKFAHADITHTLLVYLSRYKDFTNPEQMRRVVSLLHRQAVLAKAEGLFFKASTLNLFKTVLADKKSFPQDQPHKDLVNLINYILRQFFKALEQEPFLAVEAFFPKNRGNWKQYSSWEPPPKGGKSISKTVEDTQFLQEVQVKKGYSWSDQVGIAIAALIEAGQTELVLWTQEILQTVKAERERIIKEVDKKDGPDSDEDLDDTDTKSKLLGPSVDAQAKMTDYPIPYLSDEHADAATKNPKLKLLFRLCKCYILGEDVEELDWYVPAAILPAELHSIIIVITQFLETPFNLEGKKASQLMSKKSRRHRKVKAPESDADDDFHEEEPRNRKKTEKKKKEEVQYKSAQFIEDSDAEYGDLDTFLELEKKRREKTERAATILGEGRSGAMKSTGTKKRRRKAGDKGKNETGKKKRKAAVEDAVEVAPADNSQSSSSSTSEDGSETRGGANGDDRERLTDDKMSEATIERPRPRPKPKPNANLLVPADENSMIQSHSPFPSKEDSDEGNYLSTKAGPRKKGLLILSDEDE
ncbi:timeless protein-domain-containing protein [Lentinula aciculospora]|uniref:Timeless protein-domain-containing protein n=1 Tax=Lentinula aciculospora TaxID=153920 RepID=A0A9W9DMX8_9AGAR|nr:timeless protein-domain-containing protein [Lentinula aciculospora]